MREDWKFITTGTGELFAMIPGMKGILLLPVNRQGFHREYITDNKFLNVDDLRHGVKLKLMLINTRAGFSISEMTLTLGAVQDLVKEQV